MSFVNGRSGTAQRPRSLSLEEAHAQILENSRHMARAKALAARDALIACARFLEEAENPGAHQRCKEAMDRVDGLVSAIRGDEDE